MGQFTLNKLTLSDNIAIVGSSDNMIGKGYAKLIDACDDVIRFNRSIIDGYEDEVGSKITARVTNQHVFGNVPFRGRWDADKQPTTFIKDQRNCRIVLLGSSSEGAWQNRSKHIHESCEAYQVDRIMFKGKLASVGFCFIKLCIDQGVIPNVFGFGVGEEVMTHYWEKRDNITPCHDFDMERDQLKKWSEEGKIKLNL